MAPVGLPWRGEKARQFAEHQPRHLFYFVAFVSASDPHMCAGLGTRNLAIIDLSLIPLVCDNLIIDEEKTKVPKFYST